jgi:hypothetical protein
MNTNRRPPALALWLLTRLCANVITGDILERFEEGRSRAWVWRQALVAIFVGAASQWKLRWTDFFVAATGTALVGFPWELVLRTSPFKSISPLYRFMSWGAGLPWPLDAPFFAIGEFVPSGIDLVMALMVFPLLVVVSLVLRNLRPANLIRGYFVCAILFALGDLPLTWWRTSHPVIGHFPPPVSRSQVLLLLLRAAWVFGTLLIAARIARQQPKVQPA